MWFSWWTCSTMKRSRKYILQLLTECELVLFFLKMFLMVLVAKGWCLWRLFLCPNVYQVYNGLFIKGSVCLVWQIPLTPDLRIWWWSIAFVGCKKCWTASQKKGFQYFKLTGKSLLFSPSPLLSLSPCFFFFLLTLLYLVWVSLQPSLDPRLQGLYCFNNWP